MAKFTFSFGEIDPGTGSGNSSLTITADEHTGRESRSVTVSAQQTNASSGNTPIQSSNSLVITQSAVSAFMSIPTSQNVSAAGGTVTFGGYSNYQKILLSAPSSGSNALTYLGDNNTVDNSSSVTKSALTTGTGYAPAGDPGKEAEYEVEFVFNIPENTNSSQGATYTFKIGTETYTINQAAAAAQTLQFGYNSTQPSGDVEVSLTANGTQSDTSKTYKVFASSGLAWEIAEEGESD